MFKVNACILCVKLAMQPKQADIHPRRTALVTVYDVLERNVEPFGRDEAELQPLMI